MPHLSWTADLIGRVQQAILTPEGVSALATELGCPEVSILRGAQRNGLRKAYNKAHTGHNVSDRWTPEVNAKIIEQAKQKGGLRALSIALGCHLTSVSRQAKRLGVISEHGQHCVVARAERERGWRICPACKSELPLSDYYVKSNGYLAYAACKLCVKSSGKTTLKGVLHRTRAHRKGGISVDALLALYERQGGVCYYSGAKMDPANPVLRPSADRLNSDLPYTLANIVLCCHQINIMKNVMPVDTFLGWVNLVSKQHPRRLPRVSRS